MGKRITATANANWLVNRSIMFRFAGKECRWFIGLSLSRF
jgi:hypothetical protein